MDARVRVRTSKATLLAAGVVVALMAGSVGAPAQRKHGPAVNPNDPTLKLYQWLDQNHGGRLTDFYLLGDTYEDPANPGEKLQRVLRVEYDKNRAFGKLNVYVRSVGKITEEHMRTYTPKDFYEFGLMDLEKFIKTDPGPLGQRGDLYLKATEDRPLATSPITDEVRKHYEALIVQNVLPALEKK
jgi:hypothetical protein